MPLSKFFSRAFIIFGSSLLLIGLVIVLVQIVSTANWSPTVGEFQGFEVSQNPITPGDTETGYQYYPKYQYTVDGSTYIHIAQVPVLSDGVELDDAELLYNPNQPSEATVVIGLERHSIPLVLGVTGLLFLLFGLNARKSFEKQAQ